MKNDIEKFVDLEPLMNKNAFIELLLLVLADEDEESKNNEKIAKLPFNYREAIASELKSGTVNFTKILDIREFNENQVKFEKDLNASLERYINVIRAHHYNIDFKNDTILVPYTKEAVDTLLSQFDEDLISSARDLALGIKANSDIRYRNINENSKKQNESNKHTFYETICDDLFEKKLRFRKRRF